MSIIAQGFGSGLLITQGMDAGSWQNMDSFTFTYEEVNVGLGQHCNAKVVIANWTSVASGNASGTARKISGLLVRAVTVPGAGGAAPTDNYDITITDEQSVDVLANCKVGLSNRDTANTEETFFQILNNDTPPLSMALAP